MFWTPRLAAKGVGKFSSAGALPMELPEYIYSVYICVFVEHVLLAQLRAKTPSSLFHVRQTKLTLCGGSKI